MITIWGRSSSNSVQKVLWCADELGLTYERRDCASTDDAAYRQLNPSGLVPTIRDGDLIVWESNAIVRYLAARYGDGSLWPRDPGVRSLADRWMDWQQGTATPALWPLYRDLVHEKTAGVTPEALAPAIREAARLMEQVDAWLRGRTHLAGEVFTMGDIPLGVWASRWFALPVARPSMPDLEGWYSSLATRPGFRNHVH